MNIYLFGVLVRSLMVICLFLLLVVAAVWMAHRQRRRLREVAATRVAAAARIAASADAGVVAQACDCDARYAALEGPTLAVVARLEHRRAA